MAERHTERSVEPVRIHALAHKLELVVVGLVHRAVRRVIFSGKSLDLKFLGRAAKVERAEVRHTETRHEIVAQPQFSLLGALPFDDNDTVGAFLTVKDSRGGILEHIDALDVEHIQIVEFLNADLDSVQHDERVVDSLLALVGYERVGSTDEDRRNGVRVGSRDVVLHQHHTRSQGREALHQVGRRHCDQLVAADRGGRAREGLLRLRVEAVDHHSVKAGGLQLHIQPCRGADIVLLRLCSDE